MKRIALSSCMAVLVAAVCFIVVRGVGVRAAQESPLSFFATPSVVPPGEGWVFIGGKDGLPEDARVDSLSGDVVVLETQRLSRTSMAVRLQVGTQALGNLLLLSSELLAASEEVAVVRGFNAMPLLTDPANYTEDDVIDGKLIVDDEHFIYAFHPAPDVELDAVRVHNRQTGRWHTLEYGEERAIEAVRDEERRARVAADPNFHETDELISLPDTDGDGIYDFEEEPEPEVARPDFVGVTVVPGDNVIDVVAIDTLGNASWETLYVFSLGSAEEAR